MKIKISLLTLFFLNLSLVFTHATSNASDLDTLQERLAFVDLASIQETQATQDLYASLEIMQSNEPLLECFSYLKNLKLSHSEERQGIEAYKGFGKIKTFFCDYKIPPIDQANAFFKALNDFETIESRPEPSCYHLENEERGYFYTYVGVLKLFFKEIESATNYLLEARQLLLRKKPFNTYRWESKSAEEFFFNNIIQPYFHDLSSKSLNPSSSEQKLWLHFAHLNDREYRCTDQFEMAQSMANAIFQSTHSLDHFSDIELFTKIQNIIRVKDKTREGLIPIDELKMYITIVEQVTIFHPFPKLFIYRHPMTLLNGIIFLQNIVAKLRNIGQSTQDEETRYLVDQIGPLSDLQKTWAINTLSFYIREIAKFQYNEYLTYSNLQPHEIDEIEPILSAASAQHRPDNAIDVTQMLHHISRHINSSHTAQCVFSLITEIFNATQN